MVKKKKPVKKSSSKKSSAKKKSSSAKKAKKPAAIKKKVAAKSSTKKKPVKKIVSEKRVPKSIAGESRENTIIEEIEVVDTFPIPPDMDDHGMSGLDEMSGLEHDEGFSAPHDDDDF